jgi:hypothetical protein
VIWAQTALVAWMTVSRAANGTKTRLRNAKGGWDPSLEVAPGAGGVDSVGRSGCSGGTSSACRTVAAAGSGRAVSSASPPYGAGAQIGPGIRSCSAASCFSRACQY